MAATTISNDVSPEEGLRGVQVDFKDDDGVAVIPNASTIQWTLTNKSNRGTTPTVINSREQVAIASAATIYIVLEGDDLALTADEVTANEAFVERILTVEYQYNSTTLGNNLKDNAQYIFTIENLHYIT